MKNIKQLEKEIKKECEFNSWDYGEFMAVKIEEYPEMFADLYKAQFEILTEVVELIEKEIKKTNKIINDMKRKYEKRPSVTRERTYLQYRKIIKKLNEFKQILIGKE